MFRNFVENYKYFYGADYITSNLHNLLHVADEVVRFRLLPTFNAYPFENKLYLIKNHAETWKQTTFSNSQKVYKI